MTRRATDRRLSVVAGGIASCPLETRAIDDHYRRFVTQGELSEDNRIAWAVCSRALLARRDGAPPRLRATPHDAPPRESLFREAVCRFGPARDAARVVIGGLASCGLDPSDPEFVPGDTEQPEFGSMALCLLGWPDAWVRPEREAQMQRVLRQHADVRSKGERSDYWYREAAQAIAAFLRAGELPHDPELQSVALVIGELLALHADYFGHGDNELLDAFEATASNTGEHRAVALERLRKLQPTAQETWR